MQHHSLLSAWVLRGRKPFCSQEVLPFKFVFPAVFGCSVNRALPDNRAQNFLSVRLGSAAGCGVRALISGRCGSEAQLCWLLVLWFRGELSDLHTPGLPLLIEHASISSLSISVLAVPLPATFLSRSSEGGPCPSGISLYGISSMGLS